MNAKIIEELKANRKPLISNCTDHPDSACSKTTLMKGEEGNFCTVYSDPSTAWRRGDCPMADIHLRTKSEEEKAREKIRVGQQKQKKKR
jgi:hypothetical protein